MDTEKEFESAETEYKIVVRFKNECFPTLTSEQLYGEKEAEKEIDKLKRTIHYISRGGLSNFEFECLYHGTVLVPNEVAREMMISIEPV